MNHRLILAALFTLSVPCVLQADSFDNITNRHLLLVPKAEGVRELTQLTPAQITENNRLYPDLTACIIVVKTNGDRYAKLLVQSGRQKIDDKRSVRMISVERYVTFKEGSEQTLHAYGKSVSLYPGYRFSLDLGQIVPEDLPADLRFVVEDDKIYLETLNEAKIYLPSKTIAGVEPTKGSSKFEIGEKFEAKYFNGSYKLYDDGRRSGVLTLKIAEDGEVTGSYVSDKDGQNYEIKGKVGTPNHSIQFTVIFPRIEQTFQGMMFTGDGKAITGTTRLLEREAGFYAIRQ